MTPKTPSGTASRQSARVTAASAAGSSRVASGRVKKPRMGPRRRAPSTSPSRPNDPYIPPMTRAGAKIRQDLANRTQVYELLRRRQAVKEKKKERERLSMERESRDWEREKEESEKRDREREKEESERREREREKEKRDTATRDYIKAKRADRAADEGALQQGAYWEMVWSEYQRRSNNAITVGTLFWPVRSGMMADVDANTVKMFYMNCLVEDNILAQELKKERKRWHPDSVQKKVGTLDKEVLDKVTAVFQEVDRLWGQLTGRQERSTGLRSEKD